MQDNRSGSGWKFFALLFGALLAGVVGLYIYRQQNPEYDPWEEPWENSSSPVTLGNTVSAPKHAAADQDEEVADDTDDTADVTANVADEA